MKSLAAAFFVVLWWIALWGLVDTLMADWSKSRRVLVYSGLLIISLYACYLYPPLAERL